MQCSTALTSHNLLQSLLTSLDEREQCFFKLNLKVLIILILGAQVHTYFVEMLFFSLSMLFSPTQIGEPVFMAPVLGPVL